MPTAAEIEDKRVIRELIENWAVWRDALMWDRFRTVWHDDGRMMATWFQGSAEEFIRVSCGRRTAGPQGMRSTDPRPPGIGGP